MLFRSPLADVISGVRKLRPMPGDAAVNAAYARALLNDIRPLGLDAARHPDTVAMVARALERVEAQLAGHGRLLVRYSGTEPLLRIMIEGQDQDEIAAWAEEIAASVRQHLVATV